MEDIYKFLEFAESLKLVRRAEIELDGKNVIDEIYTDLLPNNGIISKVNLPRTTIVVGRKGTGKSTIFSKSQQDLNSNKKILTLYIDVKSLFDNSTPTFPAEIKNLPDSQELIKYLIYTNFIKQIILKTKEKIKNNIEKKAIVKFFDLSPVILEDVYRELDKIDENIDDVFKKLNSSLLTFFTNTIDKKVENTDGLDISLKSKDGISIKADAKTTDSNILKQEFATTLITYLDIKNSFINNLVKIRDLLKVKYLFIYLDDFSEIEKPAQELFMDWFIAPVNNLSDDFVKFKIATYPKRFYYGKLDNGKIDEVPLDFFEAYYKHEKNAEYTNISKMEQLAIDYSERLIKNRIEIYFPNGNWESFFAFNVNQLYKILFDISLNTPRKIGYILSYCFDSCLINNTLISVAALENAAHRYYSDVIEKYFLVNEHICKPFEDKISNEHQYDLLLKIVERQNQNKNISKTQRNNETSHFYINSKLSHFLDNLELNNFISTYNKVKDENNAFSTIYSLDFGLCQNFQLKYAKSGLKKIEKRFTQPLFNFNSLIIDFFNSTQIIRCKRNHEFPYSDITEFKKFKMKCPICLEENILTICEVEMKFNDLKKHFIESEEKEKILVRFQEFLILELLMLSQKALSFSKISMTLDISLLTTQRNIKLLVDKGMCEHDIDISKKLQGEYVFITTKGKIVAEEIDKIVKDIKDIDYKASKAQH